MNSGRHVEVAAVFRDRQHAGIELAAELSSWSFDSQLCSHCHAVAFLSDWR